jgi:hypothetical protein
MVPRLVLFIQLFTYQMVTMPCRDCPIAVFEEGACSMEMCCPVEPSAEEDCCGQECAPDDADADWQVEPTGLPPGCVCCPVRMPCDRCLPIVAERPGQQRPPVDLSPAYFVGHAGANLSPPAPFAGSAMPRTFGHKFSEQALLCIWLN